MNVMCPVSSVDEIETVCSWGVQEVYFGLQSTLININNRRPSKLCNLSVNEEELEKISRQFREKGITVFITFNNTVNNEQCIEQLLQEIRMCMECGNKNFIVADINLLLAIRKYIQGDYQLTLSTCMPVYNQKAIDFFKGIGISRFVLPRHMRLDEIEKVVSQNAECDFEVLVKNARCINEDGNCSYEHGLANFYGGMEGGCCQLKYDVDYVKDFPEDPVIKEIIRKRFEQVRGNFIFACGACNLRYFHQIGVKSLKIVGREFSTQRKEKDVLFLTECLKYIEEPEREYICLVKNKYMDIYGKACSQSQCYYN